MTQTYRPPDAQGWHFEMEKLDGVFRMWGVRDYSASPNVMLSRANSRAVTRAERAVTVVFVKDGRTVTLTMDDYETSSLNLKVLRLCLDDMRMIERRGVYETMQSAFMQLAAPATARDPWEVLGLRPGATADEIEAMYRVKAKSAHPDAPGGSEEQMKELNAARDRVMAVVA
ncbi:MAG: J domain-containing protein [Dehalococcoidia bacterium]